MATMRARKEFRHANYVEEAAALTSWFGTQSAVKLGQALHREHGGVDRARAEKARTAKARAARARVARARAATSRKTAPPPAADDDRIPRETGGCRASKARYRPGALAAACRPVRTGFEQPGKSHLLRCAGQAP